MRSFISVVLLLVPVILLVAPGYSQIQLGSNLGLCFSYTQGASGVVAAPCTNAKTQRWYFGLANNGYNIVAPNSAIDNFIIDVGTNPGLGSALGYSGILIPPAQDEFIPGAFGGPLEGHILWAPGGNSSGLCIDLRNGVSGNPLQLWTCVPGNANQIWVTQPSTNTQIHWNNNPNLCVSAGTSSTSTPSNGLALTLENCDSTEPPTPNTEWNLSHGSTTIINFSGNFSFDAGNSPTSGTKMKIWQNYTGIPAQSWWYTADNRIALTGQGLCLDLTNGDTTPGTRLQLWKCTTGNINQIWTTGVGL
jgi:hypothetical protein